jgi:5-methylcytosine-specific restriction endonuclease McrA
MKRKPVSTRTRFEIFKRDNFTCQYCGRKPPEIILEIDHITPISKGGDEDQINLITACFDCNRGKSNDE